MTSRTEARTNADCGTNTAEQARTPPERLSARRKEMVNPSLDTTVPVIEVPLASSSSGVIGGFSQGDQGTVRKGDDWARAGDS